MDNSTSVHVTLDPALPCAIERGDKLCNRPATVGIADRLSGGMYMLTPMCRECVTAMARMYDVMLDKDVPNAD